jgi:hypothetical protein
MTFSPKFLVFGALFVSLMLAFILLSAPGVEAQPLPTALPSLENAMQSPISTPAAAAQVMSKATLDLTLLTKVNNIDEADNARWSLVRSVSGAFGVYTPQAAVNWKELRQVSASGRIALPAGASWSFNATYGGDTTGLKVASGVLAGGQCALATVFRAAAMRAGLTTTASQHRSPIPGFPMSETVNIWWGSYDLVIKNTSGLDISMDWSLTPASVVVSIHTLP